MKNGHFHRISEFQHVMGKHTLLAQVELSFAMHNFFFLPTKKKKNLISHDYIIFCLKNLSNEKFLVKLLWRLESKNTPCIIFQLWALLHFPHYFKGNKWQWLYCVSYTIKCLTTSLSRTAKLLKKDQGSNFSFCEQASLHEKPNLANEWEKMSPSSQPLLTSHPLPQLQAEMTLGGFAPKSPFITMIVGPQKSVLCSVAPSCPTLCDPRDCNPPGSSVHGILQARILERVTMPPSGDLPNPGIKLRSPALQAVSLLSEPQKSTH